MCAHTALYQQNKPFKSKHATRRSLKVAAKGLFYNPEYTIWTELKDKL
jgi:hypothetical protein